MIDSLPFIGRGEEGIPPGPRGLDAAKFVLSTTQDFLGPVTRMSLDYGPVSSTYSRGRTLVVVAEHEMARQVLVTNQDNYDKGMEYDLLRMVLGNGLLTSEGELWRRQRSLVQPMFAKRHLGDFTEHMTRATSEALETGALSGLGEGDVIDVNRAMMELTLDVVGRALFGADLSGETARKVGPAMNSVLTLGVRMARRLQTFLLASLPGMDLERSFALNPENIGFRKAVSELDEVIDEVLTEREAQADKGEDLVGLMLSVTDPETGEGMSRSQVAAELMTFMLAGHETTSNALSWTFRWLSLNPGARDRMFAEIDEVVGDRTPDMEDVERLPWTRAVIEESMRLTPPVFLVGRKAREDDEIGGYRIPAGASVMVLIRLIHRDPRVWDNPEGFDPNRFLPENRTGRPTQAYMPFGAGRRICVGSSFAMIEAVLLMAMISRRYRFDLLAGVEIEEDASITLRPRSGLPMLARPRAGLAASTVPVPDKSETPGCPVAHD